MPKFSKFPWQVPEYIGVGFDILDADGFCIARNVYEEADARLIAAAPDLYEEVINLLEYLYDLQSQGFMPETQDDINRVEALLTRIDGKEDN